MMRRAFGEYRWSIGSGALALLVGCAASPGTVTPKRSDASSSRVAPAGQLQSEGSEPPGPLADQPAPSVREFTTPGGLRWRVTARPERPLYLLECATSTPLRIEQRVFLVQLLRALAPALDGWRVPSPLGEARFLIARDRIDDTVSRLVRGFEKPMAEQFETARRAAERELSELESDAPARPDDTAALFLGAPSSGGGPWGSSYLAASGSVRSAAFLAEVLGATQLRLAGPLEPEQLARRFASVVAPTVAAQISTAAPGTSSAPASTRWPWLSVDRGERGALYLSTDVALGGDFEQVTASLGVAIREVDLQSPRLYCLSGPPASLVQLAERTELAAAPRLLVGAQAAWAAALPEGQALQLLDVKTHQLKAAPALPAPSDKTEDSPEF
jgi:hypothetical protein